MGSRQPVALNAVETVCVPSRPGGTSRSVRGATVAVFAYLLLLLGLTAAASLGDVSAILESIRSTGVPVGGPRVTLARDHSTGQSVTSAERTVTLTLDDRSWTSPLTDLGILYDAPGAGNPALGHESDEPLGDTPGVAPPAMIPGSLRFDAGRFDAYLDRIDDELDLGPVNASVSIDDMEVEVMPATSGWAIDRSAVRMNLLVRIIDQDPIAIALSLRPQSAAMTTEHAEATKARIDRALAQPFILRLHEQQWTVAPERVAVAVRTGRNDGGMLTATLDSTTMHSLVNELAAEIDTGPTDAWVQDLGTHRWLVPSQKGRTLHRKDLIRSFESAIANGEHMIDLAATEKGAPKVTTEALMVEMGITDLIATGDSTFAGSGAGRAHNIVQAAYMIDGTLIPSGGSFSFNDAVGSLFNGEFTDAGSFIDGPSGQSLAGGVCQVSTTVFRAALNAGLPIVEWWPHSYRSPFYESGGWSPGFDASIVQDAGSPAQSADFRFENTTDSWLLVRAVASRNGTVRVELHGSDPGYTVAIEEPVVEVIEEAPARLDIVVDDALPPDTVLPLQPAMDGLEVTVVRRVFDADGDVVSTDTFVSSYRAYPAIRRVSPDRD